MVDDLKFALKRLRHSPGFVAIAVLTLAVVVGANTAILSVADAVLFRPLPFQEPDRVFLLQILNQPSGQRSTRFDNAFIDAINERHPGVGEVGLFGSGPRVVTDTPDGAEVVPTLAVSLNYLRILGVSPRRGRMFDANDTPGRAALLTDAAWRARFGGDPSIVGRSISLGDKSFDVIGVLPPEFSHASTTFFAGKPEIVTVMAPVAPGTNGGTFHPLVRLEPGVTREQAQSQMEAAVAHVKEAKPALKTQTPFLENIRETIYPVGRDVMRFLFAAALLVLLLGCANLANMLLARGRRFERDTAVRTAMGASRLRVIRPLLLEAVLIGIAGSALALLITAAGFEAMLRQVPAAAYGNAQVGLDLRVVLMGLALGIGGGVLFAVVPALRAARLDVLALLQGRHRGSRSQWRLGRPMIAVQVALAVILVFGAAIATRAFVTVLNKPLGFDPSNVVRVQVGVPAGTTDIGGFYRRVVDYLAARPDVIAAGATGTPPLSGMSGWAPIMRPGTKDRLAALVHTLPGYFEAAGIHPSAGRTLRWEDAGSGAVITEGAARVLFGSQRALGQTVDAGEFGGQLTVVGVVPAPRDRMDAESDAVAHVHIIPVGRTTQFGVFAKVRHRDNELLRTLRREVGGIASGVPVAVTWWSDGINALGAMRDPRFQAMVLGSFAAIAIGLTGLGIFGIVAFLVANRTREMGIRLAIGAKPRALVKLMVGQAIVPVIVGLAAGLLSAKYAARWAESRFVKLDTSDPWPLVIAGVVVLTATALAAFVPARRAARVDPTIVLRAE
jgi:putative ABC transport system permease protein